MADVTINFESDVVGEAPKGWMVTKTGEGNPKWTVERDQTAPSKLKVLKQSGVATYPLLLKNDSNIRDGFMALHRFSPPSCVAATEQETPSYQSMRGMVGATRLSAS